MVYNQIDGSVAEDRWYDIRVVVQGPSIKCYLDGKLIHEVKHEAYRAGGVGLGTIQTRAEFRDAHVTSLDGKDLGAALAAAAEAKKANTIPFVKKGTWPATMLATREAWRRRKAELERQKQRLGIADLRLGSWRYSEGARVGKGQSLLATVFPPDRLIADKPDANPAKPFRWGGRVLNWRGPRRDWNWCDGRVIALRSGRDAPANTTTFLHRTITARDVRQVKAYFGSDEGLVVWIDGQKVVSQEASRPCKPNQEAAALPLRKGANHLLIKLPHKRRGFRFYFSLDPMPGDRRLDTLRAQIWAALRSAFPRQTDQLQGRLLARRSKSDWLDSINVAVERTLIAEALANGNVGPDTEALLTEFASFVAHNVSGDDSRWLELFERVCDAKRATALRRCPPIAFIKRPAQGRKGTNGTMLGQRTKIGSSICTHDPEDAAKGVKTVFDAPKGFIFDMSPSFDGRKLVFSFMDCRPEKKDSFHIWEINTDGTGLRQLTRGPYHDGSPAYLPDGRIVFCSTRVESFSLCQNFLAAALFIMDGDGGNLRRIEYNTLCDTTPSVMDDGTILFGRWEYQDKNIFCVQGLWTIAPDGKRVQLFYGNTLNIPNSQYGAKQIPGTHKVVSVLAPHHGRPLGAIAITDRTLGFENAKATVNITPEIPYTPCVADTWKGPYRWGPGDVQYHWAYSDPWPIAEDLFLVTYGGPVKGGPRRYRLFLLNDKGEKFLLCEDLKTPCYCPVSLAPRPLPHKPPGAAPEMAGEGAFFVQDVYQGLLESGVKRGDVKTIRVMTQIPKKYNTEGPRYYDHYPAIGHGSYYPKICLGEVPVDENGCAYFTVPAGIEVYFQAIDADGKEVRRMGTVTQITKGETQGCIGCHESRFMPPARETAIMKRLSRGPDRLKLPPWGGGRVSFVEQVQPVLDRYCIKCHSGRAPRARLDLSGDKTRLFNMAYENLVRRRLVEHYWINQGPTGNFPPLKSGSRVSKLTERIESKHQGLDLDVESRRRIYHWIDTNAPYYGTWDMSRPYTMGGRDTWAKERHTKADWFAEFETTYRANCLSCHARNGSFESLSPCDLNSWINLTRPQNSRVLNAHLSKEAGGMGLAKESHGRKPPLFRDTKDATYQAMLKAIEKGKQALDAKPRIDMAGGVAIPQQRNFGRLY